MPKRTFFMIAIALFSLLVLVSCGSGDKLGGQTTSPVDIVSGGSTGGTGGPGAVGPGGTGGACVIGGTTCIDTTGFPSLTQSICTTSLGGIWNAGANCTGLGF